MPFRIFFFVPAFSFGAAFGDALASTVGDAFGATLASTFGDAAAAPFGDAAAAACGAAAAFAAAFLCLLLCLFSLRAASWAGVEGFGGCSPRLIASFLAFSLALRFALIRLIASGFFGRLLFL